MDEEDEGRGVWEGRKEREEGWNDESKAKSPYLLYPARRLASRAGAAQPSRPIPPSTREVDGLLGPRAAQGKVEQWGE